MKKRNLLMIATSLLLTLSSCETENDVRSSITILKAERDNLQLQVQRLSEIKSSKQHQVILLDERLKELNIYTSGRTPKYILKIHLKQSHFSLSISKHVKDAMNAIDFEMPVDRDFYNSVSVGTEIVDNFRVGSFLLYGSLGDWNMSVRGKEIR